jgi:hypothetical protein
MDRITIPVGQPLTFEALRELNPQASTGQLADAFSHLPSDLREQAWEAKRLQVALDAWGDQPEGDG